MKKIISLLMILFISLSITGCSSNSQSAVSKTDFKPIETVEHQDFIDESNVEATLSKANSIYNSFAKNAFIKSINKGENAIFSPFSLYNVLAMIASGTDNESLKQIETVMGMTSNDVNILMKYFSDNTNNRYLKANGFWFNSDFGSLKPEFISNINDYYGDIVFEESFKDHNKIADQINEFANHYTNGRINDLVSADEIDDDAVAFPVNAIAAGGDWYCFGEKDTFKDEFNNQDGSTVKADKMHTIQYGYVNYDGHDGFTETLLSNIQFIAILPNEDENVYDLLNSMDPEIFFHCSAIDSDESKNEYIDDDELGHCKVIDVHQTLLSFPKFTYNNTYELTDSMKALGLVELFDKEKADFSRMTDTPVFINKIKQKAEVEVNEKGAYASAATMAMDGLGSAGDGGPCIIYRDVFHNVDFNKPFIYAFACKGTILFIGVVDNLEEGISENEGNMFIIENYGAPKLRRRSDKPSTDSPSYGYFRKGEQAVATETYFDGEYTWYKLYSRNGFYFEWVADKDGEWIRVVE